MARPCPAIFFGQPSHPENGVDATSPSGNVAGHIQGLQFAQSSRAMKRPIIGVIGNTRLVENRFPAQFVGERNLRAIVETTEALPLMFAGTPEITDVDGLLAVVDGVLLTGARAN